VSRSRLTSRQRLVLGLMAVAVGLVFGLLGFSVLTTLRRASAPSPSSPSLRLTPLSTPSPTVPTEATSTPTASATLPPTSVPTPTRPVTLSQIQNARAVHELGRIVAELRDVSPVGQIPVTFPTEHEIAISLLQRYQEEEEPQSALALYAALGLAPRLDAQPLPDVAAQAANISSLYLPEGQQILLVAGRGPASPDDESALVRALAKALQDREFGLQSQSPCQPSTDARLALRGLVEGDAVFVAALYAGLQPDDEQVVRLAQMAADAEEPTYDELAGDAAFDRLRLFPYLDGAGLAAALHAEGDWERVNRAYARPPCSTEQVLHPERYLAGEPVQEVSLPDLAEILGEGWSEVWRDTLGEVLVALHLAEYVEDEARAWDAADGWAGDTFVLLEDEAGQQVLVWRIAWDDRDEAQSFERTYGLLIPRFRVPPLIRGVAPSDLPGRFWEGPAGVAYVARAGRIVTVVWGPDAETVVTVARVLP
jgi:hypothetical protein